MNYQFDDVNYKKATIFIHLKYFLNAIHNTRLRIVDHINWNNVGTLIYSYR